MVAVAPRRPRPERYYCRAANELAVARSLVMELAKARRKQTAMRDEELTRRLRPRMPEAAGRLRGEGPPVVERQPEEDSASRRSDLRALEALMDLEAEAAGGPTIAPMRLVVAAARLEKAIGRAIQEASRCRCVEFRSWIQEHLAKGVGALRRFFNQDNKTPCALEEIHLGAPSAIPRS